MKDLFSRLWRRPAPPAGRLRRVETDWPAAIYVIGDVHGCLAPLTSLHRKIVADAEAIPGEKWIVYVGDYVDRGPDSAAVIDLLQSPAPKGFKRICLAGNHEEMMLHAIADPADNSWLDLGGMETLASYGIDPERYRQAPPNARAALLESHIPDDHLDFLRNLPVFLSLPGLLVVHAGLRAGIPLDQQSDYDLVWTRSGFDSIPDTLIVHGHTPAPEPVITPGRICIDTGAFATGTLTAIRLQHGRQPIFLNTAADIPQL